jgi:hypothetical protein
LPDAAVAPGLCRKGMFIPDEALEEAYAAATTGES